jgi:hypothetical protein
MILGHLAGMQTNLAAGGAILLTAMTMFVLGHKIEGNLRSMVPVLVFRFLLAQIVLLSKSRRIRGRRKVARYPFVKRIHLLGT